MCYTKLAVVAGYPVSKVCWHPNGQECLHHVLIVLRFFTLGEKVLLT